MNPEKAADIVEKDGEAQPHLKKAIVISFLAMVLAIASLGSTKTTKLLAVSNIQLSNTNAIYEFRALRQLVLSTAIDFLSGELSSAESSKNTAISQESLKGRHQIILDYEKQIKSLESDESRDDDKQHLQTKLNELKDLIQITKERNERFEYAEVALQIAIVLVSASIISSVALLFWGGISLGFIGLVLTLNGYLLFF
ncbi:DUF4337 family protein [Polynucleobacter sp. 15G-AUS-farblos]|uniref:DUF4337 family protein n=1 Tax=Polynucleobacter sp. 15G-AUS-farblos TaxID=2689094 RepID=UPI001C0D83B2|nr:DUF4337 family protein [Polynucleobacter sp. 15G-AUS-farblos]MBU3583721.1 DUF4337 family protein [Polynucleobacter sp. 15G-AUS-farblos]